MAKKGMPVKHYLKFFEICHSLQIDKLLPLQYHTAGKGGYVVFAVYHTANKEDQDNGKQSRSIEDFWKEMGKLDGTR